MPELRQPLGLKALWGRIGLLLTNSAGTDVEAQAETDGTLKASMYGTATGGTVTAVRVEGTTGEQDIVLHGKDSGSNIDPLRTNADQQLQVEVVQNIPQLDPVLIPSTEGVLLDGSASLTAGQIYEVWFNVTNVDGAASVTVDVGVDLAAGGSLGAGSAEFWLKSYKLPAGGRTGLLYGGIIGADDDIRGVADVANDAAISFRVTRR